MIYNTSRLNLIKPEFLWSCVSITLLQRNRNSVERPTPPGGILPTFWLYIAEKLQNPVSKQETLQRRLAPLWMVAQDLGRADSWFQRQNHLAILSWKQPGWRCYHLQKGGKLRPPDDYMNSINVNKIQKYAHLQTQNNVWPSVGAPCSLLKATY